MPATKTERKKFIARCRSEGVSEYHASLLLRHARTLHRLAEAACNGDWPCEGEWSQGRPKRLKLCEACGSSSDRLTFAKAGGKGEPVCQDCRLQRRVRAICVEAGIQVEFNGDPRGAVVKIKLPSGRGDSWGDSSLTCVPA